ncbi:SnoaL-like domain-containing protein [Nonomuraea sp. FMUSA5-5]|uniref:SnoaL-like domain-containing protein n=1 Tax=Nonomuraea composti TaxID=2720023 RepID=A0ABX1BEE9_9ACTN|nr:nuclear transport factor 2 family protein [Nonomuraea sp. FMUSA5-5]NJP95252.1 SnoaL-like domain-containing protein [Nonomuraea sp. FMUSA5-5]
MNDNKDIVLHGFKEFAAGNLGILRTLLHEDFVEHGPGNPSGRDAWIEYTAASPVAGARLDLKRIIAEGDLVMVHYHMIPAGDERGMAVVDIWRLVDGRIAEHWDVVQPVPEPGLIPNGML